MQPTESCFRETCYRWFNLLEFMRLNPSAMAVELASIQHAFDDCAKSPPGTTVGLSWLIPTCWTCVNIIWIPAQKTVNFGISGANCNRIFNLYLETSWTPINKIDRTLQSNKLKFTAKRLKYELEKNTFGCRGVKLPWIL